MARSAMIVIGELVALTACGGSVHREQIDKSMGAGDGSGGGSTTSSTGNRPAQSGPTTGAGGTTPTTGGSDVTVGGNDATAGAGILITTGGVDMTIGGGASGNNVSTTASGGGGGGPVGSIGGPGGGAGPVSAGSGGEVPIDSGLVMITVDAEPPAPTCTGIFSGTVPSGWQEIQGCLCTPPTRLREADAAAADGTSCPPIASAYCALLYGKAVLSHGLCCYEAQSTCAGWGTTD